MRAIVLASFLVLALASCQAAPRKTAAVPAAAPQQIAQLTDQTAIWVCPDCQMEYDRAGKCPMCKVELVETHVDYICPADNQPVARAGKCPRCEANVRIIKTAAAPKPEGAASGS